MPGVGEAAFEANLAAVKATIGCERVAEEEVELRPQGRHLRGRCPLPEHQGDSPSFYCYDNGQGFYDAWYCHRCGEGGDVLDLFERMRGYAREPWSTMNMLSDRYGIRLWRSEDFMSDDQQRIRRARLKAERNLERGMSAALFRKLVLPELRAIEDEAERARAVLEAARAMGIERED